jgi:hypothetical protein
VSHCFTAVVVMAACSAALRCCWEPASLHDYEGMVSRQALLRRRLLLGLGLVPVCDRLNSLQNERQAA